MVERGFTCPVCGRTSWNVNDVREGWCNNCHGATGAATPPGMRWVLFETRDPSRRFGRLVEERFLARGSTYDVFEQSYVFNGKRFVPGG